MGTQGISSRPQGPAGSQPWSSLPGSHLGPEKYWRLWLTELFFRFEPAPHLTQIRRHKESASSAHLGGEPGGQGRAVRFGDRLCALPSAPAVGWGWGAGGRWLPPSPGVGVGSSPPPWRPPWRLRTGRDLVHQARASGTKIEPEKCLERICCFQRGVVIAVTGKVGLVGLPYTKLTVQLAFIPDSPGAWARWPFLGYSVSPPPPQGPPASVPLQCTRIFLSPLFKSLGPRGRQLLFCRISLAASSAVLLLLLPLTHRGGGDF